MKTTSCKFWQMVDILASTESIIKGCDIKITWQKEFEYQMAQLFIIHSGTTDEPQATKYLQGLHANQGRKSFQLGRRDSLLPLSTIRAWGSPLLTKVVFLMCESGKKKRKCLYLLLTFQNLPSQNEWRSICTDTRRESKFATVVSLGLRGALQNWRAGHD